MSGPAAAITRRQASEPKLLAYGDCAASFEAAAPVLEAVEESQGRIAVAFCAPAKLVPWLKQRFRGAFIVTPPPGFPLAMQGFVVKNNFRLLTVLDDAQAPPSLLSAVRREGRGLVSLRARADSPRPSREVRRAAELRFDMRETGVDGVVAAYSTLLKRDWKALRARSPFGPPNLILAAIRHSPGKRLLQGLIRAIDTPEELFDALGRPRTIMCLGNGPSSEDPALDAVDYDALFRVNRSWQKRAKFLAPDVVFTGMSQTMSKVNGAIFGVETADSERRLVKCRLLKKRRGGTRFFRVFDMNDDLATFPWDQSRPSNGAMMISTAVALRPERLVIGGVDLFSHPAGAYPGDSRTPNAYTPAHDAEIELAFILKLLETYRGELVIVGEALGEAWARYAAEMTVRP